jgi:hypothetical protein
MFFEPESSFRSNLRFFIGAPPGLPFSGRSMICQYITFRTCKGFKEPLQRASLHPPNAKIKQPRPATGEREEAELAIVRPRIAPSV